MDNDQQKPQTAYEYTDDDIHVIRYQNMNTQVADEVLTHLQRIYATIPDDAFPKLLIENISIQAQLPGMYFFGLIRQWDQEYQQRPPGRLAFVTQDNAPLVSMFTNLASSMARQQDELKVFDRGRRGEAIAWLLRPKS